MEKTLYLFVISITWMPEYVKPKNVGLMFFSIEPDKFFPYTQIDVVPFSSGLGGNTGLKKFWMH